MTVTINQFARDNPEGKAQLDFFIDPEERYPVIATTSKLMTTGVDAKTCKLIVLDQRIQSMTEFKQIIGRGTRIDEDYGKLYFTIMDFKKATELFADPDFDGDPVQIYEPGPDDPPVPPDDDSPVDTDNDPRELPFDDDYGDDGTGGGGGAGKRVKYVVANQPVYVVAERVQYYGVDGKLVTESLNDYTKKKVQEQFNSLDDFLQHWNHSDKKKAVIDELQDAGVLLEALAEETGRDYDAFDLVCHVAYELESTIPRGRGGFALTASCYYNSPVSSILCLQSKTWHNPNKLLPITQILPLLKR